LNTTVGLLGFVDVASKVGLEKSDEDLGQTLGWWGIGHGPYIVLPFLGPSSLRDSVGTFTQVYFDPTWAIDDDATIWALWGLRVISLRSNLLGAERVLDTAASDRYTFLRDAYFQRRRSQLWDGNPPREKEFSGVRPQTPSLVVLPPVWLRPADPQQAESAGGNGQTEEASASAAPIQISGNVLN
jgi:phospholipid-binding lipoprotein MlaA